MRVYPVFLNDLVGRRCVVFGGGSEAERKTFELLDCGAEVVVIAESASDRIAEAASRGALTWLRRAYEPGDLRDAFLSIVAETNPPATAPIHQEATREKVLINAMDDVPHCTFVAGSVVRRGHLVLSISTSGVAPALSVRLRERFEREFGPEYEELLQFMSELRVPMAERYPDFHERRDRWYQLVDSDLLEVLRDQGADAARTRIVELTGIDVVSPTSH